MKSTLMWCAFALGLTGMMMSGCAARTHLLYSVSANPIESGRQWVWPYGLDGKPTVMAFWSTDEMQCYRDVAALRTLEARSMTVQLVTVVIGRDRYEIDKWLHKENIDYVVLLDLDHGLASRLGVGSVPHFIFFDIAGREIARANDIRTVHNWFERPRWLKRSGAEPSD